MIAVWIGVGIPGVLLAWGVILQLPSTRGWAMEKTVAVLPAMLKTIRSYRNPLLSQEDMREVGKELAA